MSINLIHDGAAEIFTADYHLTGLLWMQPAGINELALHHLSQKAALLKSREHGPDRRVWHSSTHTWQHRIGKDDEGSLAGPPSTLHPPSHPTTSVRPSQYFSRPRAFRETAR